MPRFFAAVIVAAASSFLLSFGGLTSTPGGVMAFPTGAGQCLVGQTSVASQHVEASSTKTIKTGKLGAGRFRILINGNDLSRPFKGMTRRVKVGSLYKITIDSSRAVPQGDDLWRGVLLAATPNITSTLFTLQPRTNDTTLQVASTCATPTIGVTQTNSSRKTTAVAFFRSMNTSLFLLDANVVVANNATRSVYYYQQFRIRAVPSCQKRNGTCTSSLDCCLGFACWNRQRSGNGTIGRCNVCRSSGMRCAYTGECCNGLRCGAGGGKKVCVSK